MDLGPMWSRHDILANAAINTYVGIRTILCYIIFYLSNCLSIYKGDPRTPGLGATITPDSNYVMSTDGPRHHLRIRSVTRNFHFHISQGYVCDD